MTDNSRTHLLYPLDRDGTRRRVTKESRGEVEALLSFPYLTLQLLDALFLRDPSGGAVGNVLRTVAACVDRE
jgi:hypothetical protein